MCAPKRETCSNLLPRRSPTKKYLRIDRCQFVVKVRTIYLLFWWRTEELNPNSLDFCSTLLSTIRFSLELTGPKTPLDEYLSTFL